jgi:peptidoglycan hydrolase-like protein with peptidoglycan-binding domain
VQRILTILVALALLVGVAVAGYWAGSAALVPPELPVTPHSTQAYVAGTGTVGRSMRVAVTASWTVTRTLLGSAAGVVTAVRHAPGSVARAGDVIATVDLRPVVVAAGAVPMFRTLKAGVRGPDVRQLQQLLRARGFLRNPTGLFDVATVAAAKRWQHSVGADMTGVVEPSALVFVDTLPARLTVIPGVGSAVTPGADLVSILSASPTFVATMSASTRAGITSGMSLAIASPDGATWAGAFGTFETTADGQYRAPITGVLCGDACDSIAVTGETALAGTVVLVPERSGVVVPVSALAQLPSGAAAVTLADGSSRQVTVTAEADGFAIVDGLDAGTSILLPSPPAP